MSNNQEISRWGLNAAGNFDMTPVDLKTPEIVADPRLNAFMNKLPPLPPKQDEFHVLMSSKPIVLQGILFTMHFSGDDLLKAQVSDLQEEVFNNFKNELEDTLTAIDASHAKREGSGAATWEAMGTRIGKASDDTETQEVENRTRSIKIRMFPRSFSNQLAQLKEGLVYSRLRHCFAVTAYSSGRFKQVIYILPGPLAPVMLKEIADANKEVEKINAQIQEYVAGSDYGEVVKILRKYHCDRVLEGRHWVIPDIRYDLTPLALNPTTVMDMVKMGDKTIREKLKGEYEEGEKLLQVELERKSHELVTNVFMAFKTEIDANVANIVAKLKTDPTRVKEDLEALKAKAASIGMAALADTVITPLQALIDNPDKVTEIFGIDGLGDLPAETDGRLLAFMRKL